MDMPQQDALDKEEREVYNISKIENMTKTQLNFLTFCKEFGWGKVEVIVKDGQPVMVSPIKQDFKLDI